MVRNIGEGHLLPEMKDTISKVQNLVTETDGEAWATAFAEVSHQTYLKYFHAYIRADNLRRIMINYEAFDVGYRTTRHTGSVDASLSALC